VQTPGQPATPALAGTAHPRHADRGALLAALRDELAMARTLATHIGGGVGLTPQQLARGRALRAQIDARCSDLRLQLRLAEACA
jgi:hypothetical protein